MTLKKKEVSNVLNISMIISELHILIFLHGLTSTLDGYENLNMGNLV